MRRGDDLDAAGHRGDGFAMSKLPLTWMAFLTMAFAVVGLVGLFASFAAPLPLERALARDAALDDALRIAQSPDPAAALAALAPRLDDSAAALHPGDDLPAQVARERAAMRARFLAEADATAMRLRWLIALITLTGAAFGAAVLAIAARHG
jgi:hypothetical protein